MLLPYISSTLTYKHLNQLRIAIVTSQVTRDTILYSMWKLVTRVNREPHYLQVGLIVTCNLSANPYSSDHCVCKHRKNCFAYQHELHEAFRMSSVNNVHCQQSLYFHSFSPMKP